MRVVFLTHNYPRYAGDVAGAFLHPLAIALRALGVDLRVIAPADGGHGGADILDGVPIERVRYADAAHETLAYTGQMSAAVRSPAGWRSLTGLLGAFRAAAREQIASDDGAIVHAHWWIPAGMALPAEANSVVTCHGTDVRLLDQTLPGRWFGRRVLRRADLVTTVSAPLAQVIVHRTGREIPPDQVQPMPLPAIARPASTGGGGVVVLGRLTAQKRVELAIAGYIAARRLGVTAPLTIAGDGPTRAALERMVREAKLGDAIRFLGVVDPAEVPALLATADVMVMPARREGLGLAAAEGLMQGVPVVACTDGGGVLDVVPPTNGGRVVPPDAESIGAAITALLEHPPECEAALAHGTTWRERLAPEFVAQRCLTWYERVLAA